MFPLTSPNFMSIINIDYLLPFPRITKIRKRSKNLANFKYQTKMKKLMNGNETTCTLVRIWESCYLAVFVQRVFLFSRKFAFLCSSNTSQYVSHLYKKKRFFRSKIHRFSVAFVFPDRGVSYPSNFSVVFLARHDDGSQFLVKNRYICIGMCNVLLATVIDNRLRLPRAQLVLREHVAALTRF